MVECNKSSLARYFPPEEATAQCLKGNFQFIHNLDMDSRNRPRFLTWQKQKKRYPQHILNEVFKIHGRDQSRTTINLTMLRLPQLLLASVPEMDSDWLENLLEERAIAWGNLGRVSALK